MAHLGEFGRELAALDVGEGGDPQPDTFSFHGHEFTVPPLMSALPRLRFAHANLTVTEVAARVDALERDAVTDEELAEAERLNLEGGRAYDVATLAYVEAVLSGEGSMPEQWARFQAVAAEVGADRGELVGVAHAVYASVSGRPRVRSSVSPSGPSTSGVGSTAGSDSTAGPATGGEPTAPAAGWSPAEAQRAALAEMMTPVAHAVSGG
ncbi:MAG TPA: hypothetical protein PKL08_00855 [Thermoanaerobaculaceae bacterium]|nr:hypothetical protein [Thermoanaerobaculaceae bacterium]